MNDVITQAQQGSIAAIIQILNEALIERGVRTRAVLADGVLQMLCEASTDLQLEQATLVPKIREILEGIEPRNIRRVNICSRIAQEQQLMWLEDMAKNPDSHLLWSEEIVLHRPHLWRRLLRGITPPALPITQKPTVALNVPVMRSGLSPMVRNSVGLVILCGVSFAAGLGYQHWRSQPIPTTANPPSTPVAAPPRPTPTTILVSPTPTAETDDPFAAAVRLAEQMSRAGQTAETASQWSTLAEQWQVAANLMKAVPQGHPRYILAQERAVTYERYSQVAQDEATARQANE
jgi:hypothetical protein